MSETLPGFRGDGVTIIAEIGVNHDGSVRRALELVDHAAEGGADAIKVQVFSATTLMNARSAFAGYQAPRVTDADPAAMLRRYELGQENLERVVAHARARGLSPLATPFSLPDVETIRRLGLAAVKIASPDLVNLPLLRAAAGLGVPMLISTGAAHAAEIDQAVHWLRGGSARFALLHCISSYPTPPEQARLGWIGWLRNRYGAPVGYSDHVADPLAGALAVAAGATILEKHLTYNREAQGPDHAASADPRQFAEYVRQARRAAAMRGEDEPRRVLEIEVDVRQVSRQSLVAARKLPAGHALTGVDLLIQRPGIGIPAADWDATIGRRLARPVASGELLTHDHLEPEPAPHG